VPVSEVVAKGGVRALASDWFPTPFNWLGTEGRLYGPQAGGDDFFAQLWMVYARADKRWAGVDLVCALALSIDSRSCRCRGASSQD
jgi:hypothetical protein